MLNRLLQEFYQAPNNGRLIVAVDGGRLLVTTSAVSGPCDIGIEVASQTGPLTASRLALIGDRGAIQGAEEPGLGPCSLLAPDGMLHLVWTATDGIYHAQAAATAAIQSGAWSPAAVVSGGDACVGDLVLWAQRPGVVFQQAQTGLITVAVYVAGRWSTHDLWQAGSVWPPVAAADETGRLHLSWGDVRGSLRYGAVSAEGIPEGEPLAVSGQGQQPAIATSGRTTVIVYEDRFSHVHFAALQDGAVVHEGTVTWRHPWFMGDQVHSPQLSVDRHGVIWCFFVNNTRRSVFWCRWQGERFGDVYNGPRLGCRSPHLDSNLLPIGRLSVEKQSAAADIGMLIGLERPLEGQQYHRVVVPDHPVEADSTVLFFDGLEVAATRNVGMMVHEAARHPANPLIELGTSDAFDSDRVFNHGTVLAQASGYRMWYGALHQPYPAGAGSETTDPQDEDRASPQSVPWWDTITCGYAESTDGIHWDKVRVGRAEWNGSRDNNIVPLLRHAPFMMRDESDPDPLRRYKSLYVFNSGEMGEMAQTGKYGIRYDLRDEYFPAILFTSPDGIDLTPHEARILFHDGDTKPFTIVPQSLLHDATEPDPAKRFKAYGFTTLNLRRRGAACIYSADAVTWYAHPQNPILDPSVRGVPAVVGGPESQIHDTVVFPYAGYHLALYQYQHNADLLDVELACSRDGETFLHVQPGTKVLPLGVAGSWDAEHLYPTVPVVLDEEIRLYYGGGRNVSVPDQDRGRLGTHTLRVLPGLATLRKDGFTSVGLQATGEGSLTTIPFRLHEPRQLLLNAQCDARRQLRVEVLHGERDDSIEGYACDVCIAVSADGLALPIRWQHATALPADMPIRLRFHFTGDAAAPRLHSYLLR